MSESQPLASGASPGLRPRNPAGLRLSALIELLNIEGDFPDTLLTGVSLDSRSIRAGDLYLALPGMSSHGARYAEAAIHSGATAVLTDPEGLELLAESGSVTTPVLVVSEPRSWVGTIAERIYRTENPSEAPPMQLFGVTGTNGKTTTSYLIRSLLAALNRSSGLIGTIETLVGSQRVASTLTTPDSTDLHALMAIMRENSLDAAVMEVSSHALTLGRVDQVLFEVAGFTNLTQDHLDLHGEMEDYFAAKAMLFNAEHSGRAVITVDDEWGQKMAATANIPTLTLRTTIGTQEQDIEHEADWWVSTASPRELGWDVELRSAEHSLRFHTSLAGEFNVSNAALAVLMVHASGASIEELQAALDQRDPLSLQVPGRMQLICRAPIAVVDFAHNPDALLRAMKAVQPSPESGGRLIVVFGATGQRDQTKRGIMGALAANNADVVIVTDDDPHDEDPGQIREQVLAGALLALEESTDRSTVLESLAPRGAAIDRAVEMANSADTILLAGRGHEVWQEVQGTALALDDREELRVALRKYGFTPEPVPEIES